MSTYIKLDANGVVTFRQPTPDENLIEAPDDVRCGMQQQPGGGYAYPAPALADVRAAAIAAIDADVDAIYRAVIGDRAAEYIEAEAQAQAYAAAGYEGAVPPMVASWATAKSWTAQQAADDIIATAIAWRGAQEVMRAQRLLRKEQMRVAADAALATAQAAWAGFRGAIRAQLGLPP
jgi:hypothetical protein